MRRRKEVAPERSLEERVRARTSRMRGSFEVGLKVEAERVRR